MAAATSPRPARYPTEIYLPPIKRLLQGDIVLGFHHQLRSPGGERIAPGPEDYKSAGIPYFGEAQDFEINAVLPNGSSKKLIVRLWHGAFLVLHQNCEVEQCDEQDSRLRVAPIVFASRWPDGPWEQIRRGRVPGYLYLPDLTTEERSAVGYEGDWGEAAVVFPSATLSSKALAGKTNKIFRLSSAMIPLLQEAQVRADSVRGWASVEDKDQWLGRRVIAVDETMETVTDTVRLAKVFLEDEHGEIEEATVAWGLREGLRKKPGS